MEVMEGCMEEEEEEGGAGAGVQVWDRNGYGK